jgi:signal transduction histidine kinase
MEGQNEPPDDRELKRLRERVAELEQEAERNQDEARRARDAAEHARVAAEDARAAKSQFLATMSHELRTPLNAIDGYAELMQLGVYGPLTGEQRRALGRLRHAQKRLLTLVNDVLSFAQLESGSSSVDPSDFAVRRLFDTVEAIMAPQLMARSQALTIDRPPPDLRVHADPEGAEQILLNIMANAVKFSSEGGRIHLAASRAGDAVHIHVTDWGNGIPADRLESIFDPFVQVTGGIVRDHGGVGLGLSISRELARAMAGEIRVRSQPGEGSTFTLVLPAAGAAAGSDPGPDDA